jgi:hypothetical protein
MMKSLQYLIIALLALAVFSCTDGEIDEEQPQIDISYIEAFPANCDTLYFGESFTFKSRFTDNVELGSFSIEIHHNFDHHSHSTEVSDCGLSPEQTAINPFRHIEEFEISPGESEYIAEINMNLPKGNNSGNFDEGNYHFVIRLSDREGWSDMRGVGVRIKQR